jgi:2'-5' RNA ligase
MARLFIALWPDPAERAALAAWRDAWTWPRHATPVRTERLHATLHFLGDVPAERTAQLGLALQVAAEPFTLEFGHCALWQHGIAVLEPACAPEALFNLHDSLGQVLERLALPVDPRPYRPHVTMARRAGGAVAPGAGPRIRWPVGHYALVSSADGYAVLQRYPLGK